MAEAAGTVVVAALAGGHRTVEDSAAVDMAAAVITVAASVAAAIMAPPEDTVARVGRCLSDTPAAWGVKAAEREVRLTAARIVRRVGIP